MKKQSMFHRAVTGLILAAVFTLAGCGGDNNEIQYVPPVPEGPKFNYPSGIVAITSAVGVDLYVADTTNHTIRKVEIDTNTVPGSVTVTVFTIAGKAVTPGTKNDVPGADARFKYPMSIATDGTNLYVADTNNHAIRQIVIGDPWTVTTLAGKIGTAGTTNGAGGDARFKKPQGIAFDGAGNLYVADTGNHTIRKIVIATTEVSTIAGTAESSGDTDGTGDGSAIPAQFNSPIGVAADSTFVYVADTLNHTIRRIDLTPVTRDVITLAGIAGEIGHENGGLGTSTFFKPAGLVLNNNYLFVADQYNQLVRVVNVTDGNVATLAVGTAETFYRNKDEVATLFKYPQAITTLDGTTLYVADSFGHALRKLVIGPPLDLTVLAGVPLVAGSKDGDVPVP